MAKTIKTKSGQEITLYSPSDKAALYAKELRAGARLGWRNNGEVLTDNDKGFRAGYLTAQRDSAEAFKGRKRKELKILGEPIPEKYARKKRTWFKKKDA